MHAHFAAALLLAAAFSPSLSLPCALPCTQDTVAAGFSLASQPFPGATPLSVSTTLSDGDWVAFDGTDIVQYDGAGAFVELLGSLPTAVFPSFALADASEALIYVGESSTGNIYRVVVGLSTGLELVTNLAFNYDAALSDDGFLYVSAATCGFTCGNEIWRVDLATRQPTLVARVPGASGPIVIDGEGGLVYGTVTNLFPPPSGSSSIVRWSRTQLNRRLAVGPPLAQVAHAWLGLEDAEIVGTGFTGAFRLARDPRTEELFLAENNFFTGENRIRQLHGSLAQSPTLVEGPLFRSLANLRFLPGEDAALFRAYQPDSGGTLLYTSTDFVQAPERTAVRPLRPAADIHGPGTSGTGPFFLELIDGPPSGFARVLYGPSATYSPLETAYMLAGLPLFLGLAPATLGVLPGVIPLDGQGAMQQGYFNPGGLEGRFALQLVIYDASMELVGTSSAAFL